MTKTELRQFYEKLYFHEVDAREKIHARLQLPLTLILASIGALAFLLQNFDYEAGPWTVARIAFLVLLACASVTLVIAMKHFGWALHNHTYYFLPGSAKTAEYKALLEQTYKEFPESDRLVDEAFEQYLTNSFVQYAAFNTQVNDRRSAFIHLCHGALIISAALFIAAFLTFHFGQLDKSKMKPTPASSEQKSHVKR
jgi:hypothetical protein